MASTNDGGTTPAPQASPAPSTYSGNPATSPRDEVRFLLGDTGKNEWKLTDAEIDYLLQSSSSNAYVAAIRAALSLAAQFSQRANETVGQVSVQWSSLRDGFSALAKSLQAQKNAYGGGFRAYLSGSSRSERDAIECNPDRLGPQFRRQSGRYRPLYDTINLSAAPLTTECDKIP